MLPIVDPRALAGKRFCKNQFYGTIGGLYISTRTGIAYYEAAYDDGDREDIQFSVIGSLLT